MIDDFKALINKQRSLGCQYKVEFHQKSNTYRDIIRLPGPAKNHV